MNKEEQQVVKYPRYLSQRQIKIMRKKYKSVYALAKRIDAHQHNLGESLLQHRRIGKHTAIRLAEACGMTREEFERLFDLT